MVLLLMEGGGIVTEETAYASSEMGVDVITTPAMVGVIIFVIIIVIFDGAGQAATAICTPLTYSFLDPRHESTDLNCCGGSSAGSVVAWDLLSSPSSSLPSWSAPS